MQKISIDSQFLFCRLILLAPLSCHSQVILSSVCATLGPPMISEERDKKIEAQSIHSISHTAEAGKCHNNRTTERLPSVPTVPISFQSLMCACRARWALS